MDNSFQQVITQLPKWFSAIAEAVPQEERQLITELRLFEGQPAFWCCGRQGRTYDTHKLTTQQLRELFSAVCRGSVHCYQQEITQGFVTLDGGHRVGLCGTTLWREGQAVGLRDISSMNIRFARAVKSCARDLFRKLGQCSFLLVGAPGSGKTTLLRDYVRILCGGNEGPCHFAAVIDERSELSAFDLGHTAHVLKGLPKAQAIRQALRTLSPQFLVCDEIGSSEEAELLSESLNSGCHFIATIHGENWDSLRRKPQFQPFLRQNAVDALVFLEPQGRIREIREVNADASAGMSEHFSLHSAAGYQR